MIRPTRMTWNDVPTARHLGRLLLAAFFGTVVLFLLSSVLVNYRERRITRAAGNISDVALPSIQHLSSARTALRQVEVEVDDLTGGMTSKRRPEDLQVELHRSRELLSHEWSQYRALPTYAGERELQANAISSLREVDAFLGVALDRLQAGDQRGALTVRNEQVAPALERLDATLHALIDLNAVRGGERSESIAAVRRESGFIGISLHALSGVLALAAGFLLVRLVRRFGHLMELRATELEHFAGRVAHDIRSPLGSVGLTLDLMKKDPLIAEMTRSRVQRASGTVQRIAQLVDGLLAFAVGGAPPSEGSRANVQEVLSGVIDGIRPIAQERDIDLQAEAVEGAVVCSSGVLTSLFSNLIRNAINYMGSAPVRRIDVRAWDAGPMMQIEVSDTGPGVPADLRQKIFYPYVRAATTGAAGLGLGLATVRRLVEAHGGRVGVEDNPGGGSLFWFQLPKMA